MWVCLLAGVYIFSQTSLIAKVHIELAMNRRHRQTEQLWPHRHPGSFSSNDNGQRLRRPDNDESETFEIESEALPSGSRGIDNTDTSDASGRAFETRTSKTIVSGDGQSEEEGMAACLLIKDDNHLLIEWIAYHYLTLPLRYLVIAVDPDSFSSPLPVIERWNNTDLGMQIMLWNDHHFMDQQHLALRLRQRIASLNNSSLREEEIVRLHRDRQARFTSQCSLYHKNNGRTWVAHFDTDEYIVFNYVHSDDQKVQNTPKEYNRLRDKLPPIGQKTVLQVMREVGEGTKWKQDGCMAMVRILFGPKEESKALPSAINGIDSTKFNTLRYFYHAQLSQENKYINGLQKVLLDVSKSQNNFLQNFFTIHRPSFKMCPKAYFMPRHYAESLLRIHHYLGSWEQYSARVDDRRHRGAFDTKAKPATAYGPNYDIRPWLNVFVDKMGLQKAQRLLQGVGEYQTQEAKVEQVVGAPTCALVFFGVPRSFNSTVFPSIQEYILQVNPTCDVFVYSYNVSVVVGSRMGEQSSGALNIDELDVFRQYFTNKPTSHYELYLDTEDDFQRRRNVSYFRQFFPRPSFWEFPASMDNMIRQWHSIEGGWNLLQEYERKIMNRYSRVGFFRLDVRYTHPIAINNEEAAVIPAMMYAQQIPRGVNDRMFYGFREAAMLWASDRFNTVEEYLEWQRHEDNADKVHSKGLHSEEFLRYLLIEKWSIDLTIRNICFHRVRTSGLVLTKDCAEYKNLTRGEISGSIRGNVIQ
jgi:hypothetical protein